MSNEHRRGLKLNDIAVTALMTAVICVISPFAVIIPISPVPISLATFGIYLAVILLGAKYGTISVLIYVLLGFAGVPVFTGFTGGVGKVLGPTGGYIIGYVFLALISGLLLKNVKGFAIQFAALIVGTVVLYAFGTIWLARQTNMTFVAALFAGVIPFIVGDIFKMVVAIFIGREVKRVLQKSNLI